MYSIQFFKKLLAGIFIEYEKAERGFTLLELIISCVLISIFLVVSAPKFHEGFLSNSLKKGSRKMIGQIKGVRERAVREGQPYVIYFDLNQERVWHQKDTGTAKSLEEPAGRKILRLGSEVDIQDVWTKSDDLVTSGIFELWINNRGYHDEMVIHLKDEEQVLSLMFSTFSPSVRVEDGYVEVE